MLVEYGFETKDEEMLPRAIELRKRMASRRLTNAVKVGAIGEKGLKNITKKNEDEMATHTRENFNITMADVNEKIAVGRAEQQLNLEAGVRRLHRDVDRASKLSKSRLDILGDLESRIMKMREQLVDPTPKTVEQEIGNELVQSMTQKNDKQFEVCTLCQRRILVQLFEKHITQCQEKEGKYDNKRVHETKPPVFDVNADKVTRLATFLPKPPRNCKVVETGATFIRWVWEEPVSDGGLPVYEYELAFTEKFMEMNKKTRRYVTTVTEVEHHATSLWCVKDPICHAGCKITGLKGNTEYNNFRIRSKNLRGWSDWAQMMEHEDHGWDEGEEEAEEDRDNTYRPRYPHVRTEDVEPPSPPMFLRLIQVTSSCIHLAWDLPFYYGGSPLTDFIIYYTVNEVCTTTTERDVVIPFDEKLSCEGIKTSMVLRNLPADTVISKVRIKAQNKVGLLSEALDLPWVTEEDHDPRTKPASRYVLVHQEFDRCTNSKEQFIDTSFFTGTQQRLLRVDYMRKLEEELKTVKPDELERQEGKEWMAEKERRAQRDAAIAAENAANDPFADDPERDGEEDEVMDEQQKFLFSNQQRRQHFKRKLESLKRDVVSFEQQKYDLDTHRSKLITLMKAEQQKRMQLRLERDRVKSFKGAIVTSSVLQGAPMQYVFGDFMKKLDAAIVECDAIISESKFEVMAGETRKQKCKRNLEKAKVDIKDRQAMFLLFEQKHRQTMKALHRLNNADQDEKIKRKYFDLLFAFGEERKGVRQLFTKCLLRRLHLAKKNAFFKWLHGDEFEEEVSLHPDDGFISRGAQMLDSSRVERLELQNDLRNAIASTTNLVHRTNLAGMANDNRKLLMRSRDFRNMEEGMDHLRYNMNGMHFLYEADGYAKEGNFVLAYSTYEAQIIFLRSQPELNIKLLAITHGRLGRMFLLQGKFDRAIVEFDRQLSLAREIDDKPEQADAYYGVGRGYLEIRDYENALRYLNIAQTRLSSLGNVRKYCDCMRALKEIYERLGETEPVKMYAEKISRAEGELEFKLGLINAKLGDLTLRLNNTNAEIEHMVKLERTSLKAIQLKVEINELHEELEGLEKEEEEAEDRVDDLKDLLAAIQGETDQAFMTDDVEMISHLVHDQPQVIEVEELKNRLAARRKEEIKNLQGAELELTRLKVKVHNFEDVIHEKDALLDLENGPLMTNSRHDQAFRCVAFCEANAQGDEVTGTNTGGAENFVAAEGNNIHVLDYHSGELLHVFAGESPGQHREGMSHESFGHGGVVTCLVHDCASVYSGSTDETVRRWDIKSHSQEVIFRGHEGSITAIAVDAVYMCSGSADATIRLWNKHDGRQLRTVYGHHKSVLSLDLGSTWMLSGSADEEVRVWSIKQKSAHTTAVDCKNRLIGHEVAVTCVKYSKLEIISCDVLGRVFIWWMKTGEVIRKIQAHSSAIKSLQFDAVNIVTGGVDHCVDIIDIATGEVQQKLRGHEGSVLAVAFDSERIISVGGDNTLRYWQWGKKVLPQDKFHVLDAGQTLMAVSKLYPETNMQELMKWNGIKEARQIFPGMKLIVKKGDPGELTEAEKAEAERERRREAGASLMSKRVQTGGMLKSSLKKYDRVHRNATDEDLHSLGNRMFKDAKEEQELYPDKIDLNANPHALSRRIDRDFEAERRQALVARPQGRYFMNKENEEEWGAVSDQVCAAMLSMFIEYESYEMVMESKRQLRSTTSVIGRIHAFEAHVEDMGSRQAALMAKYHVKKKRFLMPEERKALRKAEKKEAKKKAKADAAATRALEFEQQQQAQEAMKAEMAQMQGGGEDGSSGPALSDLNALSTAASKRSTRIVAGSSRDKDKDKDRDKDRDRDKKDDRPPPASAPTNTTTTTAASAAGTPSKKLPKVEKGKGGTAGVAAGSGGDAKGGKVQLPKI